MFDPSIGPQYPPCSKRESKGPKRRVVMAAAASTTLTLISYAVFQSRPIAKQEVMIRRQFNTEGGLDRQLDRSDMPLMTFLPNFLQRRWTAGRPLQTFPGTTALPSQLHCPQQCKNGRFVVTPKHDSAPKLSKSLVIVFTTFSATREIHSFWSQVGEN